MKTMDRDELLKEIDAHLKRTGEKPYPFGGRVLGDPTFLWKMRNGQREPTRRTVERIMAAIEAERPKRKKARKRNGK